MNNDELNLRIKAQTTEFNKQLDDLNVKAKALKNELKEIEKTKGINSAEYQKAKTTLKETETAAKNLAKELRSMDVSKMSMKELNLEAKNLAKEMLAADRSTKAYADTAKRLGEVEREFGKAKDQAQKLKGAGEDLAKPNLWQKITGGVTSVGGAFKAIMALQIIGYILEIGKAIFGATAKMEKYEKVLTTAFGGNAKLAKESLGAIKEMAKDTIFTVDELTEGYVKMVNRGMKPSKDEMVAMADLAASQGKTFDQLVEAALDAQTGEMERLREFGVRATKSGDQVTLSFKGMNQTVKNTPDAIQGALTAFGKMNSVAGSNAKMMETLDGKTSNLSDSFFSLAAELGESLRPVFIIILNLIQKAIPVVSFLGKALSTVINVAIGLGEAIFNAGKTLVMFINGNYVGAAKAWEDMKKGATNTAKHIATTWTSKEGEKAAFAGGTGQGTKYQGALTDAQKKAQKEREDENKKHQEEVKKANEEAIKKISEMENDAYIEHIRRTQGEVAAEKVKLQQKAEAELLAVYKSLATEEQKAIQSRLITTKLQIDLENLEEKHQKETSDIIERWTEEEFVKKIKKAQDFANSELANARKHIKDVQLLAQIETKINESLKNDIAAIKADQEADTLKKAEETAKKQAEISKKKLDAEKFILQQETEATKALFDWKELDAKGNAKKLLKVQKERLDEDLRLQKEKLKLEQQSEELEAKEKIKDKTALEKALFDIQSKYHSLDLAATKKVTEDKVALAKSALAQQKADQEAVLNAFSSILKGDVKGFSDNMEALSKAFANGIKLDAESVLKAAQIAVTFLNDLAQKKAERAIAEVQREYEFQKATIDKQLAENKDAISKAEDEKKAIKEASSEKIKSIKEQEEVKIKSLEDFYRSLSSADAKMDLNEQIDLTNQEAEAKIEAAKKAADEAKSAAREARDEKIIAAEAARDAEINAIKQRNDIDKAAKEQLIASSKAKAEQEISIAKQEYESKVKLSADETKAKIKDATKEKEDKIELMKQLQTADKEKAKQLIDNAKEEAKEKVAAAEKEKNEKLKIVEQEKAKKVQEKKDLEAKMHEEDVKAKQKEYDLKMKAWKAQQKADIASALIGGALAVVKALSAGFPLGLVMAAVTAVMTGIQIAKIKNQAPPAMPTFATGGLVDGPAHGASYGTGGLAIIHRKNNREVAEMEGGEWIVDKHQTAANLPLLRAMKAKTLKGDRTPLAMPVGFRDGGAVTIDWTKRMYRYGGRVVPMYEDGGEIPSPESVANQSAAAASAEGGESANADRDLAKKQAEEQLENQKKQLEELMKITKRLEDIESNTSKNVGATNAVERAVKDSNTSGKFDGLIGAISKFGGRAA